MADIELVIKIPEEDFEIMKHNIAIGNPLCPLNQEKMVTIVANGTPLPKGHSDLIDADKAIDLLNQEIDEHDKMMAKYEPYINTQIPLWWWKGVCAKSVVIEADKAESEE